MIRVLIADDHPVVREGLRRIIEDEPGMSVAGEATNGDDVLAKVRSVPVDVVLLDISMPGLGFLDVLRRLKEEHPRVRVLVLSMHPEDQYAVRALRAGAAGYLTKDHSPEQLMQAIGKVVRGGKFVSAALAEKLAHDLAASGDRPAHDLLSDREYQVLCLLGSGRSVKEVAATLSLSPKTASTYRARVLEKMRLSSNADLVRYAAQHGLIR
jgi:two-component system, NarL family, invasion response regulator UvrY